jgi:hypothetical protein
MANPFPSTYPIHPHAACLPAFQHGRPIASNKSTVCLSVCLSVFPFVRPSARPLSHLVDDGGFVVVEDGVHGGEDDLFRHARHREPELLHHLFSLVVLFMACGCGCGGLCDGGGVSVSVCVRES